LRPKLFFCLSSELLQSQAHSHWILISVIAHSQLIDDLQLLHILIALELALVSLRKTSISNQSSSNLSPCKPHFRQHSECHFRYVRQLRPNRIGHQSKIFTSPPIFLRRFTESSGPFEVCRHSIVKRWIRKCSEIDMDIID
jgi:hypothetical protein